MRIILADHHPQALWALKTLLQEEPQFDLIGEAVEAESLLLLAEKHTADLVLVDKERPGSPIEDLIVCLHALEPRPIVMVMSSETESSRMLLKSGADAFVSKGDSDWLLEILDKYVERLNQGGKAEKINGTATGNINPIH
jgi:two-component system response regulator FimZ (fimbrial Z protein)/two-component system response regulator EvgA